MYLMLRVHVYVCRLNIPCWLATRCVIVVLVHLYILSVAGKEDGASEK